MPYLRHTEVDEIAAASREVARRVVSVKASLFSNRNMDSSTLSRQQTKTDSLHASKMNLWH